jgi:hypothetical protein
MGDVPDGGDCKAHSWNLMFIAPLSGGNAPRCRSKWPLIVISQR